MPNFEKNQSKAPEQSRVSNLVHELVNSYKTGERLGVLDQNILVRAEFTSATLPLNKAEMELSEVNTPTAHVSCLTHTGGEGSKYQNNEDTILCKVDGKRLLVGIFDGAGGSQNGHDASIVANAIFLDGGRRKASNLVASGTRATVEILANARGSYATGVILEMLPNNETVLLASGDSKAITIRKGMKFEKGTTKLQNLTQQLIDNGKLKDYEYYTHKSNNIITGAFGVNEGRKPVYQTFTSMEGDQTILASDGVWDVVSEYEIILLAKKHDGDELKRKIFDLAFSRNNSKAPFTIQFDQTRKIDMQALYGGGDNISVVVVEKKKETIPFAIGDYIDFEGKDNKLDYNWKIKNLIEDTNGNWIQVSKMVDNTEKFANVPIEEAKHINPDGSRDYLTFDEANTLEQLYNLLDSAEIVQGSQLAYTAATIKDNIHKLKLVDRRTHRDNFDTILSQITDGKPLQHLVDAIERVLKN